MLNYYYLCCSIHKYILIKLKIKNVCIQIFNYTYSYYVLMQTFVVQIFLMWRGPLCK